MLLLYKTLHGGGYKKVLEKTKARLDSAKLSITQQEELQEQVQQQEITQDYSFYNSFDFPEIEWEDAPIVGKSR